jgi:adenosylhomocysteinase
VVEIDPVRALSAAMEGYRVVTADEAARTGDVFITVTGNLHVLRGDHFDIMKDGAILANAGHFDVELDLSELEKRATGKRRIRHELDEWTMPDGRRILEWTMPDGRRILVVSEGRLVNLSAAEGHPAEVMDMSFSNQALAAEWLLANGADLDNQVYRLPEHLDDEVAAIALEALGGGLETLTPEQKGYLASWQQGT